MNKATAVSSGANARNAPGSSAKPAAPSAPRAQPRPAPAPAVSPVAVSQVSVAPAPAPSPVTAPAAPLVKSPADRAEDLRPIIRTIVEEALIGRNRIVQELQRRVEELERRPPPAPVVIAAPAPVTPVLAPVRPPSPSRGIDIAAIERTIALDPEMQAFDGRRRRVRLMVAGAFVLLVVFAGLFAALAQSYTHAHP